MPETLIKVGFFTVTAVNYLHSSEYGNFPNIKVCIYSTAWKLSVLGVFLVGISPHSDWIRRDIPYLSMFSSNAGKYGPENIF